MPGATLLVAGENPRPPGLNDNSGFQSVSYSVNLLTCTLCTAGVNRTGLGPNGVVVWSWVYLLGGWNRVVGETMLGSEKKSFNYYKEGTFDAELIKWQQVFYNCNP